jgi:bla regulator protein blaR1
MILKYFSGMWMAIPPALGDHLWQSTLFSVIAGLLTLTLRKNRARTRYGLWLAASVKFLVPFSLLVGLGSHLPWARSSAGTKAGLSFAIEEVSQPFAKPLIAQAIPQKMTVFPSLSHALPAILAAAWLCGFVLVVFVWYVRWQRVAVAVREAVLLTEGREAEALRQLERRGGIRKPIPILVSRASLEPGVFGIARPALIWPKGISERLDDAQLEAVLAHEVWHVRHRDNLAAAVHMVVEAIFWFYPPVWWLGARLVEERERACDQEVLRLGSARQVYAESILKTCEFCLESPLICVSGVTGADLKKRMVLIMTERVREKLGFNRKLLLGAAGLLAIALPVVFGLLHATQSLAESGAQSGGGKAPAYEVASIKPNKSGDNKTRMGYSPDGFNATESNLLMLLMEAYGVNPHEITGAPDWLNSERYDIEAKTDRSTADELFKLNAEERRAERQRMLQALLADRFKLVVHRETKELPVYVLAVAKGGPKFHEAKPGDTYPNGMKLPGGHGGAGLMFMGMGELTAQGLPIAPLVRELSLQLGRTVIDKTGLTGEYDFSLKWTSDVTVGAFGERLAPSGTEGSHPGAGGTSEPESSAPSIFPAIQDQLGLKLESEKGPVEILVIDHVEKPSAN